MKCRAYQTELSPWGCLENQLSPMCLPGWPCETCEEGVTIAPSMNKDHRLEACATLVQGKAEGAALSRPTAKRMPAWLKEATPAVRRSYGY